MHGAGMRIEVFHASKYGNGEKVAEEFKRLMAAEGNQVNVHNIDDVSPKDVGPADLYIFGSPTHMGKATGSMVRFLKKLDIPSGTNYASFCTCSAPRPDKESGALPTEDEHARTRRTIPMIDEQLADKGMVKVGEMTVYVRPETMKGPLEDGWEARVEAFVSRILKSLKGPSHQ